MSFPGGLAYTGDNAYAYAYAYSANAYAYSAPGDVAGIGGFAADPMLSAAIIATRDALLSEVDLPGLGGNGDRRYEVPFSGANSVTDLPKMDCAQDIAAYGGQVRASMALFELSSSVAFRVEKEQAILEGTCTDGARALLTAMRRPNRAYFEGQLKQVDAWASRRDVRAAEILTQVTPPLGYFASLLNLQAGRHKRTLELVNAALQFTYAACMRFKHALACPRPGEYSVAVQAMIEVPMHPSLPAGHAAEGHVTAAVLGALAGAAPDSKTDAMLRRLAHRIAENRVVAGLHFPVDLIAGRLLGDALASYFLAACGKSDKWIGGTFEIGAPDASKGQQQEFSATDDEGSKLRFFGAGCDGLEPVSGKKSPLLAEMWSEAADEWKRKGS
jgi:hypothetical protein